MRNHLFSPAPLHIPDGFLNFPVSLAFWLLSAVFIAIAVRRSSGQASEKLAPLMGIMAAFIFAGQFLNFPIAGGTSGHLLGGTLAAITLGPWGGILVMTTVIAVQAVIFQDGGLLAMGANIFNMGILTVIIGYGLYRAFAYRSRRFRLAAAGLGAWLSVLAGAALTGLQLWLSGMAALQIVMPIMAGIHALIGIGEGLITVAALSFIERHRPDILSEKAPSGSRAWAAAGILISIVMVLLAPYASVYPDGLERAAIDLGFIDAIEPAAVGVLPDYTITALGDSGLSTIAAGLAGLAVVGLTAFWLARRLTARRPRG